MKPAVAGESIHLSCSGARTKSLLMVVALLAFIATANAQTDFTRIYGPEDQNVPTPAFIGPLGRKDAGALQELVDYLKAVNILSWKGLQASGTLTDSSGNVEQATLTILNGDQFRLDVQTPKGERSTRISGSYGQTLEAGGKKHFLPRATAKSGLLVFPRLLSTTFPLSNTSFIDRGIAQINGHPMHRITLAEPVSPNAASASGRDTNVTDLYFDPSSHLLLMSATSVQVDSADRERYLIVNTYGNYQKVQASLIPCTFSQSLDGQPQWTLRLDSPKLQPSVDPSYFHF